MKENAEQELRRWEQEDAEVDTKKQKAVLQTYKDEQTRKMEKINQLIRKISELQSIRTLSK